MTKESNSTDAFIRWQETTRNQFAYAIHLILGLSTASLGYSVDLLLSEDFHIHGCLQPYYKLGIIVLLASIGFGIATVISRLKDFRITTQVIRKRELGRKEEVSTLRKKNKTLGKMSWCFFYIQLIAFFLGITLLTIILISND